MKCNYYFWWNSRSDRIQQCPTKSDRMWQFWQTLINLIELHSTLSGLFFLVRVLFSRLTSWGLTDLQSLDLMGPRCYVEWLDFRGRWPNKLFVLRAQAVVSNEIRRLSAYGLSSERGYLPDECDARWRTRHVLGWAWRRLGSRRARHLAVCVLCIEFCLSFQNSLSGACDACLCRIPISPPEYFLGICTRI